jgi:hypothetical protein
MKRIRCHRCGRELDVDADVWMYTLSRCVTCAECWRQMNEEFYWHALMEAREWRRRVVEEEEG